ncbi:MAG TPA: hypothetical protein DCE49_10920, partial [Pseudomonas sp.]|nr:hypothetical protein [Pseudomonas sp.]
MLHAQVDALGGGHAGQVGHGAARQVGQVDARIRADPRLALTCLLVGGHLLLDDLPGVGKTTLARLTAYAFDCEFIALSAVLSGVKDIRAAIEQAEQYLARGKHTILFIDEIHRFNKSQQDAFLPYVEDGTLIFIGATTENPSFELNNALLSRARVYVLKSLDEAALRQLVDRALTEERGLGNRHLTLGDEAFKTLLAAADGDGRRW